MNGVTFLIAVVLFAGFFVGLSGLLVQSTNEVNYRLYSDTVNYTNATGTYGELPDSTNQLTLWSYFTNISSLFPSLPGFDWFFLALAAATGIVAFIVIIRGTS